MASKHEHINPGGVPAATTKPAGGDPLPDELDALSAPPTDEELAELAKAGDLKSLRSFEINPVSSSPKAIKRYRDLCIVAIEAQSAR